MLYFGKTWRSFGVLMFASFSLGALADDDFAEIAKKNKAIEAAHQEEAAKLVEAFTPGEDQAIQKYVLEKSTPGHSVRSVIYPGSLEDSPEAKKAKRRNLEEAITALERSATLEFDGKRLKSESSDGNIDDQSGRDTDEFKSALQSFFRNALASSAPVAGMTNFKIEVDRKKIKNGLYAGLDAYKISYDLPNGETVVLVPGIDGNYRREHYKGTEFVKGGSFGINKETMKSIAKWMEQNGRPHESSSAAVGIYAVKSIKASAHYDNNFSSYDVTQPKHTNNPSIASSRVVTFPGFEIKSLPEPKKLPFDPNLPRDIESRKANSGGKSLERPTEHPPLSEQGPG